jgi:hypothetical protein
VKNASASSAAVYFAIVFRQRLHWFYVCKSVKEISRQYYSCLKANKASHGYYFLRSRAKKTHKEY